MSPLTLTKNVVCLVCFEWKDWIFTTYSSPKSQNQGTNLYLPFFQRIVCTLISNVGELFGIPGFVLQILDSCNRQNT